MATGQECEPRAPALLFGLRLPQFGTRLNGAHPCGQRRFMQKDIATIIVGDKTEALFLVVPLDLAGWHNTLCLSHLHETQHQLLKNTAGTVIGETIRSINPV